ncbi:MAG TPA: hypothetical protein VN616_18505 [Puia sp.]|nr:hypothetical protein [Puia sp.]
MKKLVLSRHLPCRPLFNTQNRPKRLSIFVRRSFSEGGPTSVPQPPSNADPRDDPLN